MSKLLAIALLSVTTFAVAQASDSRGQIDTQMVRRVDAASTTAIGAPEIDPSSIAAGLTLLAGGLAVIRGRRAGK